MSDEIEPGPAEHVDPWVYATVAGTVYGRPRGVPGDALQQHRFAPREGYGPGEGTCLVKWCGQSAASPIHSDARPPAAAAEGTPVWSYGPDRPAAPVVVPAPDPERDRRIKAYRDRERARFVRALDRFLAAMSGMLFELEAGKGFTHGLACGWPTTECIGHMQPMSVGGDLADAPANACPHGMRLDCGDGACQEHAPPPTEEVGIHQKAHYGVPETDVYRCWNCSFATASSERFTGHLEATGHADDEHRNPDYVDPCAGGCTDPAAHAEGGHDV